MIIFTGPLNWVGCMDTIDVKLLDRNSLSELTLPQFSTG